MKRCWVVVNISEQVNPSDSSFREVKMKKWSYLLTVFVLFGSLVHADAREAKKSPTKVEAIDYTEKVIYHSPEKPGYTAWVGLALLPDGPLRCDFAQMTGPKDKPLVSVPVLESRDGGREREPGTTSTLSLRNGTGRTEAAGYL